MNEFEDREHVADVLGNLLSAVKAKVGKDELLLIADEVMERYKDVEDEPTRAYRMVSQADRIFEKRIKQLAR